MTLVESVGRKCAFLAAAAARLGSGNVEVVNARAEEWPDGLGAQDVVVARALAPLPVLLEYAAPLLEAGGLLVAWKGRREAAEEADGAAAAGAGDERAEPVAVEPFRGPAIAHLYLSSKVSADAEPISPPAGNGPQAADPSLDLKVMALRRRTKTCGLRPESPLA